MFTEEIDPFEIDRSLDQEALTPIKRTVIMALQLMPEIADDFEALVDTKHGSHRGRVTPKTRSERVRRFRPGLEASLFEKNASVDMWRSFPQRLFNNCRVMHSRVLVCEDQLKELMRDTPDVPLLWRLVPSKTWAGDGSAEGLKPWRNYFLAVSVCWSLVPVYHGVTGTTDWGESTFDATDFEPGLLHAENILTNQLWMAHQRRESQLDGGGFR